jgi:hypothetical protein
LSFFACSSASFCFFCSSLLNSRTVSVSTVAPVRNISLAARSGPLVGLNFTTPVGRSAMAPLPAS